MSDYEYPNLEEMIDTAAGRIRRLEAEAMLYKKVLKLACDTLYETGFVCTEAMYTDCTLEECGKEAFSECIQNHMLTSVR